MANECIFCNQRHIPTNTIVLNGGHFWCEFCSLCGEKEILTNEKGEHWLVRELFESSATTADYVRKAEDIAVANALAQQRPTARPMAEEARWLEQTLLDDEERAQLRLDAADNLVYRQLHSGRFRPHADALKFTAI